jgi:hypothetical protein
VVVDIHGSPRGVIEKSISEAAHQAESRSSGLRGDDGCGHPLDTLEE